MAIQRIGSVLRLQLSASRGNWAPLFAQGAIFPLAFFAILASQQDAEHWLHLAVGLSSLSAFVVTLRRTAQAEAADIMTGRLALLRTTGVTALEVVSARVLDAVVTGSITLLPLLFLIAIHVIKPPAHWGWILIQTGTLAIYGLAGAFLGAAVKSPAGINLLTSVLVLAIGALCPLLYSIDRAPALLRPIVGLLPPTLAATAMERFWVGDAVKLYIVAILLAWFVIPLGAGTASHIRLRR